MKMQKKEIMKKLNHIKKNKRNKNVNKKKEKERFRKKTINRK